MDIRSLINEEIADYIRKLDSQRDDVKKAVDEYEEEENERDKLQKGLRAEEEKQKLYTLEAQFLKEKVIESKKKQREYKARMSALGSLNI